MSDNAKLKELAEALKRAIEQAEHKPGEWAGTAQSMGGICCPGVPFQIGKPWAKEEPWASFSYKRDSWLAVAAVNALPRLLGLIADNEWLTAAIGSQAIRRFVGQDDQKKMDELVSAGIQVDKDRIAQLEAERDQLKADNERLRADYAGLARFNPEWDRVAAAQDSVREHMAMVVQLKAENAGLKTGYEAYERVNAELKAENERLNDEYDKAWRHDLNGKKNVQVLAAEVARLSAENEALRKDADRAAYWKQRAKSAEGHLFSGDFRAAAMELHKYSRFESTPWPELTGSQHALITSAAGAVIATVNRLRDARRPKNRDETDAIIWCACGDGHAANSYGAGFMDANGGVCANCDAAVGSGRSNSRGIEQDQIPTETPVPERSACRSENP